jgi:redox-sensitive bicupin YhaK (pirin superfamily)
MKKNIERIIPQPAAPGMVGDGFRVYNYIPGSGHSDDPAHAAATSVPQQRISPFLLLDFAAEVDFPPTTRPRGVGVHPHKGFETVTIAYKGSVAHNDSAGNSGVVHPGDVQWMTAGSGILHKEYHEEEYSKKGGPFEMVQLWVNLPKKDKLTAPHYQAITAGQVSKLELPAGQGHINVIAGTLNVSASPAGANNSHVSTGTPAGANSSHAGAANPVQTPVTGPAHTYTPVIAADLRLNAGAQFTTSTPANYNTALLIVKGSAEVNGQSAPNHSFVLFENKGEEITIKATEDTIALLLSGEPINEPIFAYGPFVMNTKEEVMESIREAQSGKFGELR